MQNVCATRSRGFGAPLQRLGQVLSSRAARKLPRSTQARGRLDASAARWSLSRIPYGGRPGGKAFASGEVSGESPNPRQRSLEELTDEISKMDLDKVTETFGSNFGPQPDFHTTKSIQQVREELKGVVDLEQVGGIFDLENEEGQIRLPMEPIELEDEAEKVEIDEGDDDFGDEDEDYFRTLEKLGEKDPIRQASEEEMTRKGEILLKMINAGKRFEEVLDEHLNEVDDLLLRMLDGRIAQAEDDKEPADVVRGLTFLFDRLAMEKERQDAPDEMRLLDACLDLMIPDDVYEDMDTSNMAERRLEVMSLLEEAFALPGSDGRNIDVFGLAAMIGPQQNLDLEEIEKKKIYGTNISRESFVRMVEETIREVEESQRMEFETLKRWSDEILGSQHTPEEKANLKLQIQDMSKALIGQRKVLAITKEVLKMAKAIRWP